ncbi:hypothetical protein [Clostridium butyricum]|uniref:hypothetical protein n=1 Tax=Clostridium butyricum TaxID=1492 RepID=UPI00290A76D0|nr:hypothetical protein [Clostridium butyricum]
MESNSKCKNGFEVIVGGKEKEHGRKKNVNSYKVGSRLIYNKTGYNFWGNWFVEEIKGKKIKIRQLALDSITKVYNASYLDKLINEGTIEVKGKIGEPKSISDNCKTEISNLKIFSGKGIDKVEQLLLWGAEKCDWKAVCNEAYVDKDKFEKFMKILEIN